MNLIKCGLLGVVAASALVAACGSSSSDDSASKAGSGNTGGSSSSTAGSSSSSTAGSSSSSGGKSSGTGGSSTTGTAGTGAGATGGGATCTGSMDPTGMMSDQCPDLTACAQSMCKSAFDACNAPCADYQKCVDACNCDATCVGACTQSDACSTCGDTAVNCIKDKCSTQFNTCISGALGDAGGGKTCKDLADCCKTLPMDQQADCMMSAMGGLDAICDLAYSLICTAN